MPHELSSDDQAFRAAFEAGSTTPDDFDHRAHVRLAYCYLVGVSAEAAVSQMRRALRAFLEHHGLDVSKYHETMTRAWILAVRHFMELSPASPSAAVFIDRNPQLLDTKIMLTHYSADHLFSQEARTRFVEPDLDPIPRHDAADIGDSDVKPRWR